MINFSPTLLNTYKKNDVVLKLLLSGDKFDQQFTSHKWLLNSVPKRLIFYYMYDDLLEGGEKKSVLDVGGGYTSATKEFVKRHDYTLLDIMTHDDHGKLKKLERKMGMTFWQNIDWYNFKPPKKYDLIIANDLFPNVDQRLKVFMEKFLPIAKEIRISLTYYNSPRFYKVKRFDADEVFFIVPWSGEQVAQALKPFKKHITLYKPAIFKKHAKSIFTNGRQVVMIKISSDKSKKV